MRVLFATANAAGHFRPLLPLAQACLRAGHEVLVAGAAGAAPLAERAGLRFRPVAEPSAAEIGRFRAGQDGLDPRQAAARAFTNLYIGLYGGAALPGMVGAIEDWRPDVVVREIAEASSLVAADRLGVALDGGAAAIPALAEAVRDLLADPRYGDRAREIADEIQALPPVENAVDLLSELAGRH